MSYSINLEFLTKKQNMSFEDALNLVSRVGFDALDYTSENILDSNWFETAISELRDIEKSGLFVTQTHAQVGSSHVVL